MESRVLIPFERRFPPVFSVKVQPSEWSDRPTTGNSVACFNKDMFMSRHQDGGQNHNLLVANTSSENVAKF
jgi:hypothetical protein